MATPQPAVIVIKDLHKTFRLPHEQSSGIKQAVVNFYKRKRGYELQKVLRDVSFEVRQGEFFGIVGRNGSGKSTLLKLLAGIYAPDEGLIHVGGSLTPFIELGVGFNPELTGRENVFLNGALLGFNHKEMEAMYDDIVAFAEIERFMDQKLKNYSSGMQVRLAFSIAIRAESDILLIDEVLAVGDAEFQDKCLDVFKNLKANGKTIVFISHDMGMVRRFCDRAIMLQNGEVLVEGSPEEVAEYYEVANLPSNQSVAAINKAIEKRKDKIILSMQLLNQQGKPTNTFVQGEEVTLRIKLTEDSPAKNLGVAIYTHDDSGYVFGTNTVLDNFQLQKNEIDYSFRADIGKGRYTVKIGVFGKTTEVIHEFFDQGPSFQVKPLPQSIAWEGVVHLKHNWRNLP